MLAGTSPVAIALVGTQSRSACLGLMVVAILWAWPAIRAPRGAAWWAAGLAGCMALWFGWLGRGSSEALQTGASVRGWLHAAALMQGAEAAWGSPARVGGLAEDAAMRFGFPLGLEQGRMILTPLSTLLGVAGPGALARRTAGVPRTSGTGVCVDFKQWRARSDGGSEPARAIAGVVHADFQSIRSVCWGAMARRSRPRGIGPRRDGRRSSNRSGRRGFGAARPRRGRIGWTGMRATGGAIL